MNQDNTKLPSIPFDASKQEDLARLKAGWPLVQRDGTKFEGKFLAVNEQGTESEKLLVVNSDGIVRLRSMKGEVFVNKHYPKDLFFASNKVRKSKWVAVVGNAAGICTMTRDTKDEIFKDSERISFQILSGPVELPWEVDAPLPPVEQPKAGWYVGPVKEGNHAKDLAKYVGLPVTYGTLTEVQP